MAFNLGGAAQGYLDYYATQKEQAYREQQMKAQAFNLEQARAAATRQQQQRQNYGSDMAMLYGGQPATGQFAASPVPQTPAPGQPSVPMLQSPVPQTPAPGQPSVPMLQSPSAGAPAPTGAPPQQQIPLYRQLPAPGAQQVNYGDPNSNPLASNLAPPPLPGAQKPAPVGNSLQSLVQAWTAQHVPQSEWFDRMEALKPSLDYQSQQQLDQIKLEREARVAAEQAYNNHIADAREREMERHNNAMEEHYLRGDDIKATGGAGGAMSLDSAALNQAAWEKLYTGKEMSGLNTASAKIKVEARNREAQIIKSLRLSPAEAAMLPTNIKVQQKAMSNMINWGAGVQKSQQQLDKTMDKAIEAARAMDPGEIQRITKMVIQGKKEFGSGPAAAYAGYLQTVRTEYARLMSGPTSNAMLPQEAQQRADELITTGASIKQLQAMKSVIQNEAQITVQSVNDQVDSLKEKMLDPSLSRPGQTTGAPKVGAVENGYRFKGGDPSKQENWEPAQ